MNKRTIQAFAAGILFSVSIIGAYYYFGEKPEGKFDEISAKKSFESRGYTVLPTEEFEGIKKKASQMDQLPKAAKDKSDKPQTETTPEPEQASPEASNTVKVYDLVITSGMSPDEIAEKLTDNSIIDDQQEFKDFLINKGYHTKIQLGTFNITEKMTYEQIARTITR